MNVICILSIVYVEGEACVCVVILSKMAEAVTRGEEWSFFEKKAFLSPKLKFETDCFWIYAALRFNQKHLNLCSEDERRSYGFGTSVAK